MPLFKPSIAPKTQTAGFMVFSAMMLMILTSVVLSLFLNTLQIRESSETLPTRRIQDLISTLNEAQNKSNSLERELGMLRKKLSGKGIEKGISSQQQIASDPELQQLYKLAGLTPVKGEGITITLEDTATAQQQSDPHADPNAGKLQADDLLKLINELKSAGAKAVSINDQRLIATSEVITAGDTIVVNQNRLLQPVKVNVIGDPELLINALKIRGGILEYLNFYNIKVKMEKQKTVSIPAYKGAITN